LRATLVEAGMVPEDVDTVMGAVARARTAIVES
jgi:hypothetical protein